jgi:hypothetical protein
MRQPEDLRRKFGYLAKGGRMKPAASSDGISGFGQGSDESDSLAIGA